MVGSDANDKRQGSAASDLRSSAATNDGLLLVDKPRGLSSHDVVARARRALQTKRIGHTGTLDPMATGLLVLAVGEGTKLVAHLTEHDKRYACTIQLGVETDSLDADGAITSTAPVPAWDEATLRAACDVLERRTLQVPPMVSAVRVNGERLYERARRGEVIEVAARQVTLHRIEVMSFDATTISLQVHCGKGYYIRALARDLALELGTVGHLTQLRRTQVGEDLVSAAVAVPLLEQAGRGDEAARSAVRAELIALPQAVRRMRTLKPSALGLDHARHGRVVPRECIDVPLDDGQTVVLLDTHDVPVAIGTVHADGIKILRGFVSREAPDARTSEELADEANVDVDAHGTGDGNSNT